MAPHQSTSSTTAALLGFAAGSAVTVLLGGIWMAKTRRDANNAKNKSLAKSSGDGSPSYTLPAEIREEQLSRHTLYFGKEGMERLRNAKIVVVGVGGVGSHVAHMLGRAGVGHLRLIDFDQVTVSSLNRHACATLADVGIPKVTCMKDFLERICPDPNCLKVEAIPEMYTQENGERLLQINDDKNECNHQQSSSCSWDIVIDAIDDVPTKAALLAHCLKENIRVMSCMGAGGKSDITRLHISDLRTAAKDPLASKLRQSLKKLLPPKSAASKASSSSSDNGTKDDNDESKNSPEYHSDYMETMEQLAIIYSSEKPVVKLADFTPEQKAQGVHTFGAVDGMRIRVLPVLGTMPAVMGQTLAAMAVCELGGKPISPVTGERVGRNVRNRMYQHLKRREDSIAKDAATEFASSNNGSPTKFDFLDIRDLPTEGVVLESGQWIGPLQVDQDDICYLMEVWRNRCAVTGDRLGTVLELVRWDLTKPSCCNNLVLMGTPALKLFDGPGGKGAIPDSVKQVIETRLASCNEDGYYG